MTQDLRQPSPSEQRGPGTSDGRLAPPRLLVVRVLWGSAAAALAAGLYLLLEPPEFLPSEAARMLAVALIVMAVADWGAARLLQRLWRARPPR